MNRQNFSVAVPGRLGLTLGALIAAAAIWHAPAYSQADQDGVYVGVGGGQGFYKWSERPSGGSDLCGFTGQLTCEDSPIGYKLFVGYNLNKHLGIEGGYYNAGTASLTFNSPPFGTVEQKLILHGFSVSVVGTLPLGSAFISGRVGVAAGTASRKDEVLGSSDIVDRTKAQPIFGIGAGFKVWRAMALRLDWDHVRGETFRSEKFEADLVTLNLLYRFE